MKLELVVLQIQLLVRAGIETLSFGFQALLSDPSVMLPPTKKLIYSFLLNNNFNGWRAVFGLGRVSRKPQKSFQARKANFKSL